MMYIRKAKRTDANDLKRWLINMLGFVNQELA